MCTKLGGELMRRRILGEVAESMINEEFELLGEIDVSNFAFVNSVMFEKTCDCSELLLIWTDMENSTNTDSMVNVNINDIYVDCGTPKTSKSGSKRNGYTLYKCLNGCGTISVSHNGATSKTMYGGNAGNVVIPYNLMPITERFRKIKIYNVSTQYYATSGTIKVYGR